jgi:putative DNA primase/helicase
LLRDVITGKPTGVHRIALHPDGKLIGRMGLGIKQGSAVKLWGDAEITTALCVGEGIETTLAAATRVQLRNTLLRPAWSLVDAPNIASFPVLPGGAIEHLTILCDADHNETGQRAARTCAKRWAATGCDVEILIPNVLGEDFNDLIKRAA